jgi:PBSX family phage terminase large subunit
LRLLLTDREYQGKTALVIALTSHHARNQLLEQHFRPLLEWEDAKGRRRGLEQGVDYTLELAPQIKLTFSNGSKILFASLEAKQNLSGYSVSIVMADEIDKDAVTPEIWNVITSRARGESEFPRIIATCNPANQSHWLYERYFSLAEQSIAIPGTWCGTVTIYDNSFLSALDVRNAEERYSYSALDSRRLLYGEWVNLEGMVFTAFERARDLYNPESVHIGDAWPKWAGLDFGYNDPTACLWIAKNPADNRYYVYREYYEKGRTPEQNAQELLKGRGKPRYFVCDHYAETLQTYKALGLPVKIASKGKGSIEAGIALLNQLLSQDRLRISKACVNFIRELESYAYDHRTNMPKKNQADHAIDAARYVLWDVAGKAKGGLVVTPRMITQDTRDPLKPPSIPEGNRLAA